MYGSNRFHKYHKAFCCLPNVAPLYLVVPSLHASAPAANHLPVHILILLSTFQWHPFWLCLTSWKSQIIQINRKQGEAFPLAKETNKPHEKEGVVEVVGGLRKGNSHRCLRNKKYLKRLKHWAKEKEEKKILLVLLILSLWFKYFIIVKKGLTTGGFASHSTLWNFRNHEQMYRAKWSLRVK